MKLLSWAAAVAALCLFSAVTPASSATVIMSGTGSIDYAVDEALGEASAIGTVASGIDSFHLDVLAYFDPLDPTNAPSGNLLITGDLYDPYLDGLLESIEIGTDYVALVFGDLMGPASSFYKNKLRLVFTDFDWAKADGKASVEVQYIAPVPLPAGALLLLGGLGGLVGVTRLRRRSVLAA